MGSKRKILWVGFLTLLLITSRTGVSFIYVFSSPTTISSNQEIYTPSELIHLFANTDFEIFPGSGTEEDPYIIEGFQVTGIEDDLIYIEGTDAYFILRNNLLAVNSPETEYSIRLVNVENGVIESNIITDARENGIHIESSNDILIQNNEIINNFQWGIFLSDSSNLVFKNNTIASNGFEGVGSYTSNNNLWINNTILDNSDHGVRFELSNSNIFKSNIVSLNGASGIWLGGARNNVIQQNKFSNNTAGIEMDRSMNNLIIENDIASNDIGVSLVAVERNNITNNRITDNKDVGISIDIDRSIEMSNAFENNIEYNFIDGSSNIGINLAGGKDNKIHNNLISNGGDGLTISGGSTTDEIACNLFEQNLRFGITLSENTQFETISQNDFVNNQNSPQASDDGSSNTFQNNYWNELEVENQFTAYTISGSSDNTDSTSAMTRNTNSQDINSICYVGPKSTSIGLSDKDVQIETGPENSHFLAPIEDNNVVPEETLVLPISIAVRIGLLILLLAVPIVVFLYKRRLNIVNEMESREEMSDIGFDEYEGIGSISRTPVSGLCVTCGTYSEKTARFCSKCEMEFT